MVCNGMGVAFFAEAYSAEFYSASFEEHANIVGPLACWTRIVLACWHGNLLARYFWNVLACWSCNVPACWLCNVLAWVTDSDLCSLSVLGPSAACLDECSYSESGVCSDAGSKERLHAGSGVPLACCSGVRSHPALSCPFKVL